MKIATNRVKQVWMQFDLSNDRVATTAQQAAHFLGTMAVIHNEQPGRRSAEETPVALFSPHYGNVLRPHAVFSLESRPKVFGFSRARIIPPPASQSLIALLLVLLCIDATTIVRACLAVRPEVCARLREFGKGFALLAGSTLFHLSSITQSHDILDQPCHADVLLEIANERGGHEHN